MVALQTKVGYRDTAGTLSHVVATLQTKVGDEDAAGSLSHDEAILQSSSAAAGDQLTSLLASSEAAERRLTSCRVL